MDQEKIGKFILKLRKEKNMTQQELANKLTITDRAISKWENGRGMPDLSLMKPLCNELDISINELISGEKIENNKYKEKSEENILNTIIYSNKKIKNIKKLFKLIISIIQIFTTLFLIDVRMMSQNKPVVFSTWGYLYTPAININENHIYQAIKNYHVEKMDAETKHHNGEKSFMSMNVYLLKEEKKDSLYYVYAWVVDGKYYLENNELKEDSSSSIPHKFTVEKINGEYKVTNSMITRDGGYY